MCCREMSLQNRDGGVPDYNRPHPTFSRVNEPTTNEEETRKRAAKQKNADKRFNSPFGFHEPKYQKVGLFGRYPRVMHGLFVSTCLLLFFSKPIYDATLREPTTYELERAEFLKKRMQASGLWESPFPNPFKYIRNLVASKNEEEK